MLDPPVPVTAVDIRELDHEALLATGGPVHIRPARVDDQRRIGDFYDELSDSSNYFRFFGIRRSIPERELHALATPVLPGTMTLLASIGDELVGIGEFHRRQDSDDAEVAFAVRDDHQHEGVATLLLEDLAVIANRVGLRRLTAITLMSNEKMKVVFRTAGLHERHRFDDGVVEFTIDVEHLEGLREQTRCRHEAAVTRLTATSHSSAS
jgi:RimJ/RimL family protein N-acetyltransferase